MVERLISQLAHVEVITPKIEESAAFYRDVLGLEESERVGQSVYFRGWGEFFHHSLQLTEGPTALIQHIGWRTEGPDELETLVKRLEADGAGIGWQDPVPGHGPAYRFESPGGHVHEVFWEIDRYVAPPEMAPTWPNRPQRYVTRGAGARRIDHVTLNTQDVVRDAEWCQTLLGKRFTEVGRLDGADLAIAAFPSSTPMSHDLGFVHDRRGAPKGARGRANHVAFWLDSREDILRTADLYHEAGLAIEFGPGRHGVGENFYLYVREPGGMRVELFSGGYMLFSPDLFPMEWKASQGMLNAWDPDYSPPDGYAFHAFPLLEEEEKLEQTLKLPVRQPAPA